MYRSLNGISLEGFMYKTIAGFALSSEFEESLGLSCPYIKGSKV